MNSFFRFLERKRRKFERRRLAWLTHRLESLYRKDSTRKLDLKGRLVLYLLGRSDTGYRLLPMLGYSTTSTSVATLAKNEHYTVEAPRVAGTLPEQIEGVFPAIEVRLFKAVEVSSLCSAFVMSGRISVPDYYTKHDRAVIRDDRKLSWHSNDGWGIARCLKPIPMAKGIMLFAAGANNWYHWLIEVLPVAFLAGRLPPEYADFPLVVPAEIAELPTFRDSLNLLRQGREVIALDGENYLFELLIVVAPPVCEPMNFRHGYWPNAADYSYNPVVLREYRNAILAQLNIQTQEPHDRIFLARGHGRRVYNQDELLAIAERHGFRAVHIEQLSFREQVELLSGAKFVVGPSGAAFANTLFCSQGTRLLTWLIPQYSGFCSYANLARAVGSELRYIFAEPDREVLSTFEGYSAEYLVDPVEFEQALVKALTSDDY